MKRILILFSFLVFFFFVACEKTVINHGYIIESTDFSKIMPKKDTAMTVYQKFGAPTMRSSINASDGSYNWYYVSKRTEKTSFLNPKVLDDKTMVVSFNKLDLVTSVKTVFPSKSNIKVNIVKEKTVTKGKMAGIVGETFGGLGKYLKRYTETDKK